MKSIFAMLWTALATLFSLPIQFFAEPDPNAPQSSASYPYPVGKMTPGGPGQEAQASPTVYDAPGAIPVASGSYVLRGSGALAMTLAAPTAGPASSKGDDGKKIRVYSATAFAHTVTTPANKIQDGSTTTKDTLTFAAHPGAIAELEAWNGVWQLVIGSTVAAAVATEV